MVRGLKPWTTSPDLWTGFEAVRSVGMCGVERHDGIVWAGKGDPPAKERIDCVQYINASCQKDGRIIRSGCDAT
jgi:hypothetical protein